MVEALLATGDTAAVDRAMEEFIALYENRPASADLGGDRGRVEAEIQPSGR
jgi:hypothetical protein